MPTKQKKDKPNDRRKPLMDALDTTESQIEMQQRSAGGVIVPRAGGGGVIVPRAGGGGVIVPRAGGGGVIVPRSPGLAQPRDSERRVVGLGWQPDVPDYRDYNLRTNKVQAVLGVDRFRSVGGKPPKGSHYDNIRFCSPVEDQGYLGSCTAHAVSGMMEYMMNRAKIRHLDLSRLFLYKVSRKLLGWTGDTGAYLRTTLQAAATFGVVPERYWPYNISSFEDEPEAFAYAYASNFQALNYTRLDDTGTGAVLKDRLKTCLKAGLVATLGFPVYSSISQDADISFPTESEALEGGHAVLAVGYDDDYVVKDEDDGGAIIIQNSWGTTWGMGGYGYLPYRYFKEELIADVWTILKQEWIDPMVFA